MNDERWGHHLFENSHIEQGSNDAAANRGNCRNPAIVPVGVLLAFVRSKQHVSNTRSRVSGRVHCVAGQAAEGSTHGNDDAVYKDPADCRITGVARDGSQGEYQHKGREALGKEVEGGVPDGRSCAEAAADRIIVIRCLDMIAIEAHQNRGSTETAEHLANDVAGNICPGKTAADGSADCYGRVEMRAGCCAKAESGNHNGHAPSNEDMYGIAALHAGFVQVDIAANAITKDDEEHCSDKFCDILLHQITSLLTQ